ncbi:MAG: YciI family protein [Rhodothalassiaceae bacterium]
MSLFAIIAHDKDGGRAIRATARQAHLDYLADAGERLKLAGPLRDAEEKPIGSLIVIDAASETAARLFAENDPYAQAGLFARVEIHSFAALLGRWAHSGD